MKVTRYDGSDLRRVLTGMVTDTTVCARVSGQWPPGGLFDASWANLVGGWCVDHMRKYGQPPNGQLRGAFDQWAAGKSSDDKVVAAVEKFLRALSDAHEKQESSPSSDYLLDVAGRYFNKVRVRGVIEQAEEDLDANDVERAVGRLAGLSRVELGKGSLVKLSEDYDAWRQAFDADRQVQLIHYPGRLDDFLGSAMVRDALIAFMGPDKSGKSMWLLDAAYRAIRDRHRVAYFEAGDMSQDAVLRRLAQRATRRPIQAKRCKHPTEVDSDGNVKWEYRQFDKELTPSEVFKAIQKVTRKRDVLRLACYPNSSISVTGISSTLGDWEREGWVPDLVVIDYADILAPPVGVGETLDQIDVTWKHLRRMSQELHCLVLTATQSNAAAYGKQRVLGRQHFSGRKTKLAHVNGMIGLNVSPEDKKNGVTRLNWVVKRDGYYNERWAVPVAGCWAMCCPAVRSVQ